MDAIVNAANNSLLGGGGVDGAIHRAAGPELLAGVDTLGGARPEMPRLPAAIGSRRATSFMRSARSGLAAEKNEEALLAACYRSALELAPRNGSRRSRTRRFDRHLSFSPRSRRADRGRHVASEIAADPRGIERIVFCCFSPESAEHHKKAFAEFGTGINAPPALVPAKAGTQGDLGWALINRDR